MTLSFWCGGVIREEKEGMPASSDNVLSHLLHNRERGVRRHATENNIGKWIEDRYISQLTTRYCNLPSNTKSTISLSFSPTGRSFASSHGDHSVKIIAYPSGKTLRTLTGHPRTPWVVKFHPNRPQVVASACLGLQVIIWDITKPQGSAVLSRYAFPSSPSSPDACGPIFSIAFYPYHDDCDWLLIAAANGLYLWKYSEGGSSPQRIYGNGENHLRSIMFHLNDSNDTLKGANLIVGETQEETSAEGVFSVKLSMWAFDASAASEERWNEIISNPRVIAEKAVAYNDGGFDVSSDGRKLVSYIYKAMPADSDRERVMQRGGNIATTRNAAAPPTFGLGPVNTSTIATAAPILEGQWLPTNNNGGAMDNGLVPPAPFGGFTHLANTVYATPSPSLTGTGTGTTTGAIAASSTVAGNPLLSTPTLESLPHPRRSSSTDIGTLLTSTISTPVRDTIDASADVVPPTLSRLQMNSPSPNIGFVDATSPPGRGLRRPFSTSSSTRIISTNSRSALFTAGSIARVGVEPRDDTGSPEFSSPKRFKRSREDRGDRSGSEGERERERHVSVGAPPLMLPNESVPSISYHSVGSDVISSASPLPMLSSSATRSSVDGHQITPLFTPLPAADLQHTPAVAPANQVLHHAPAERNVPCYLLAVVSLEPGTFGNIIQSCKMRKGHAKAITSVKFSPTNRYLLCGYSHNPNRLPLAPQPRTNPTITLHRVSDLSTVNRLSDGADDVNVAFFHPNPSMGLVYGTKAGRLCIVEAGLKEEVSQSVDPYDIFSFLYTSEPTGT